MPHSADSSHVLRLPAMTTSWPSRGEAFDEDRCARVISAVTRVFLAIDVRVAVRCATSLAVVRAYHGATEDATRRQPQSESTVRRRPTLG